MRARTLLVLAHSAWAAAIQPAQAPTFDCATASGQVEKLICEDADLAALDRKMAEVYAAATKAWPESVAIAQRAYQRGWIKGRDDCGKERDPRACAETSYRTRIVELQIKSGQLTAPDAVAFTCAGAEDKPFQVAFYTRTEPPSALITYNGDQVIAFAAPSASGARYVAANVAFWEHQGEASVEWFGAKMTCRPRTGGGTAQAPRQERRPLGGTSWVLAEFQSMDDTVLKPSASARYALTFNSDGTLVVQSDCNRGRSTWRSPDAVSLELGSVALTRAQCASSPLQDRFVKDLGYVRSYVVRARRLYLSLMADGGIYVFDPAPHSMGR